MMSGQAQAPVSAPVILQTGATNVYSDLELIVEPRLSDVSTTAWYVTSDNVRPIMLATLAGTAGGVSTESDNGWTVDGISYKIRLEAGSWPIEYRGAVKNAGA